MNRRALGRSLADYTKYLERINRWIRDDKGELLEKEFARGLRDSRTDPVMEIHMKRIDPVKKPLAGDITVPGDKSIAHRAVIFGSLAQGA